MPNIDGVDVVTLAPVLPSLHDVICSLAGGSSSRLVGRLSTWLAQFQPGPPTFNLF